MCAVLQVRGLPEEQRRTLKARTAVQGESLNAYLLKLIAREVAQPTVGEVLERAARRAERPGVSVVEVLDAARTERDQQ